MGPRPAVVRNAVVQSLSRVLLFATPWTAARQASLSITNFPSLLKLMSVDSVMPSKHLILCRPLLLPSIFPSIRVFSNELALKESLGLEKKTTVSKALAESSNFGENKTELMLSNWYWRRLESPLDSKEIQPVHPKGDQSRVFIG